MEVREAGNYVRSRYCIEALIRWQEQSYSMSHLVGAFVQFSLGFLRSSFKGENVEQWCSELSTQRTQMYFQKHRWSNECKQVERVVQLRWTTVSWFSCSSLPWGFQGKIMLINIHNPKQRSVSHSSVHLLLVYTPSFLWGSFCPVLFNREWPI